MKSTKIETVKNGCPLCNKDIRVFNGLADCAHCGHRQIIWDYPEDVPTVERDLFAEILAGQ